MQLSGKNNPADCTFFIKNAGKQIEYKGVVKQNANVYFIEKEKYAKKVWDFLKNGLDKTTKKHYNYRHQIAKARRCNERNK